MNENFTAKSKAAKPFSPSVSAEDAFEKTSAAAEHGTKLVQEVFSTATRGAADFNLKLIEILQANTNAAFDFARQIASVKSPSEFLEHSTSHARKQLETFTQQTKELATLAQKAATEAAAPVQQGISKTFNNAR